MKAQKLSFTGQAYKSNIKGAKTTNQKHFNDKKVEQKQNTKVALAAFAGATLPIIAINTVAALKKGNFSELVSQFKKLPIKDKAKSAWKLLNIDNFGKILATTTGGILAGSVVGAKDKKSKNEKQAIYKEGVFEFANSMIPAAFVTAGLKVLEKAGKGKSAPLKVGVILSTLVAGMFTANKVSNKINDKAFEKTHKDEKKRGFKPKDIIAQLDDLGYVAVLSKIPVASKLQIDKFLPLIYAKMGYEAGTEKTDKA